MRPSAKADAGSVRPLRIAASTDGPMNSTNVPAPRSEHLKVTTVAEENVSAPVVRSSRTS